MVKIESYKDASLVNGERPPQQQVRVALARFADFNIETEINKIDYLVDWSDSFQF